MSMYVWMYVCISSLILLHSVNHLINPTINEVPLYALVEIIQGGVFQTIPVLIIVN